MLGGDTTTLQVVLSLKDDLSANLQKTSGSLSSFGSGIQTMGKVAAGIFAAVGGAAVAFGVESVKAFNEAQVAHGKMVATLTTMGQKGTEAIGVVEKYAEANTKMGFSVKDSETALSRLFQLTGNMTMAQTDFGTAMDISRLQGIDLNAAVKQTALAIDGGGRLYKQYGINVKEAGGPVAAFALLQGKLAGQAKAFSETNEGAMQALAASWNEMEVKVGGIIAAKLTPLLMAFTNWFVNHQDQIVGFAQKISDWGTRMWIALQPAFNAVIQFFSNMENRKAVIIAVLAMLTVAFVAWGVSVIMAMAPITLAIIALGALIALFVEAWDGNWGGMRDMFLAVWDGMKNFYESYIVPLWKKLKEDNDKVMAWWRDNWAAISNIFQGAWLEMKGIFEILWAIISGIVKVAIDIFTGNWSKAWSDIQTTFANIWKGIKDVFSGIWQQIQGEFVLGINFIIDKINGFIKGIDNIKLPKELGGLQLSIPNIPRLAQGTNYVPQDMMAVLHQGEAVVPKQYNNAAGGGGITINITGNNSFNSQADMDMLIRKIRIALSRDTEKARYGMATSI